jgi:hypothetical protein
MAQLIRNMKRFQTRRQGVASSARRALTLSEFKQIMAYHWRNPNKLLGMCCAAALAVQLSMIARGDDVAKFREFDLGPYELFPLFGIVCRIAWSQNVTEERDAPIQLLLGSMDTRYCVLANLAMWMESYLFTDPTQNDFVFKNGLDDPDRIKDVIRRGFNHAIKSPEFMSERPGLIGTHSVRKLAVTHARSNGCTRVSDLFCNSFLVLCLTNVFFIALRMTSTTEAAGRIHAASKRLTPIQSFPTLMPRWLVLCAGVVPLRMLLIRGLAFLMDGFCSTLSQTWWPMASILMHAKSLVALCCGVSLMMFRETAFLMHSVSRCCLHTKVLVIGILSQLM